MWGNWKLTCVMSRVTKTFATKYLKWLNYLTNKLLNVAKIDKKKGSSIAITNQL